MVVAAANAYAAEFELAERRVAEVGVVDANIHDLRAMSGTEAERQGLDPQKPLSHT